jgi:uncharacterized membrane protein YgdD (TMEM256/DUF423 family)
MSTDPQTAAGARWIAVGAILAGLAVACGALAAHGLDSRFTEWYAGQTRSAGGRDVPLAEKYLADFRTAAEYQMDHALGLVAVGLLWLFRGPSRALTIAAWSLLLGCVLFSGSLYMLTLTGFRLLGAVTPVGGIAFLVGWGALAASAVRSAALAGSDRQRAP